MPVATNAGESAAIEFLTHAIEMTDKIVAGILADQAIQGMIEEMIDAVYLKSSDGKVLVANANHKLMFGGGVLAIGRNGADFLHKSIVPVAQYSDDLIVSGCQFVLFEHVGLDNNSHTMRMRTFKRSLFGIGHPKFAILGISRVIELATQEMKRRLPLPEKWSQYIKLDSRDQEIARQLAMGLPVRDVAAALGVADKTIENHRKIIFERLNLESIAELIKLMVRLQDNGFADFGL